MESEDIKLELDNNSSSKNDLNSNDNQSIVKVKNLCHNYGFIITRHVTSDITNKYWNHCVKQIRLFYPDKRIIIIDDNSNYNYVKAHHDYKNVITVQSKFTGRGELLPYIYYASNKSWFEKAVIIHDSVFFHYRIPFEKMNIPAIPLWHFGSEHFKTHFSNNIRVANVLNYNSYILKIISNANISGCFGVQTFITHKFLLRIMKKYHIHNLVHVVKNREDRCSLERVFAAILYLELGNTSKSILGNIFNYNFGYTFNEYNNSLINKKKITKIVKVFTGR
jgi:hypothetical protein